MSSIVERLRKWSEIKAAEFIDGPGKPEDTLYGEAAAEIERLRSEILATHTHCPKCEWPYQPMGGSADGGLHRLPDGFGSHYTVEPVGRARPQDRREGERRVDDKTVLGRNGGGYAWRKGERRVEHDPRRVGRYDTRKIERWATKPVKCPICGYKQVSIYPAYPERPTILECNGCGHMMEEGNQ